MNPRHLLAIGLCGSLAVVAATARADDDRFTLRVGAMLADAESRITGRAEFGGDTYDYDSDRFDIGDDVVPRIEGTFRFADRHRIHLNYFRYDAGNDASLGEDVTFGGTTFPAGSRLDLDTRFDLGSVVYDFGLVETPTFGFGLQVGAETAGLRGTLRGESGEDSFRVHESERGTAPVVGTRLSANTSDGRWRFVAQSQYLDADWGDFGDYDGDITRANALVEYRFMPKFGIFAGYDWFDLDVTRANDTGRIGFEQRFHGPIAGVTFAF